jgi:inner membrane protein
MAWWVWVLVGLGLLFGEILTPGGFYLVFFGVGALVTGFVTATPLELPEWGSWLLFSAFSVGTLLIFRRPLLAHFSKSNVKQPTDGVVGEVGVTKEAIAPKKLGKVELRGTNWSAKNVSEQEIPAGHRCSVTGMEGLTLLVQFES